MTAPPHYDKRAAQLNGSKFIDNARLQVILRNNATESYIGIWLIIGRENGSIDDRRRLKQNITDNNFLNLLFNLIIDLGNSYFVEIGDEEIKAAEFKNPQELFDFLKEDNYGSYYIIYRNYDPNDDSLSEANIADTVLAEFSRLYKMI